ncbi:FimV/HubP family polar landmark protein [Ghiorsea bivora]|uniref:FimV/HubP family polar landmark protein n=1 Tax=Ghiorsea bivora TaxID=1485545 RepID=UPI00068D04DE|nr:FimV/HubP family polar landmark protein [Ghiorsea bivora]
MLQRAMHVFLSFVLVFLFGIQSVGAVSFERIDVASHIGEPFYAEVPLRLDGKETLSKISVELGSSSDYRILEVYRDQVINQIRTDIVKDERGARVKLTSEAPIDTAFFNLVLKVRYGRSTHYKKLPIFLESAAVEMMQENEAPKVVAAPVNAATVQPDTSDAFITKVPQGAKSAFVEPVDDSQSEQVVENTFKPYSGWARTSRYGPMVYGDTITVVAKRLRLDDRFTNQQVMVALFEKNKDKFGKGNINLIKAGSYLDVPAAEEVEQVSVAHAKQVISEQNKVWKNMTKQPKYAAVADAQKHRYTRRVRIGQKASGVASAPMLAPEKTKKPLQAEEVQPQTNMADQEVSAKLIAAEQVIAQKDSELSSLQNKMSALEERLQAAEKKANEATVTVDAAALDAQNKRLEIVISRLKGQLEKAKASEEQDTSGWLMYALSGLGLLVLGLIGAVVMLLRRQPKHPAEQTASKEEVFDDVVEEYDVESVDDQDATKQMDVDDFEMPSDLSEEQAVRENPTNNDEPLEEIPDFTDDETGEMDAFDSDVDETPDPSVNYLEEADVYLRYGMEDEAEKQVRLALKLDDQDAAAHAKLVRILRMRKNSEGEEAALNAAKAVLVGSALATFEGLLADSSAEAASSDDATSGAVDDAEQASEISALKDDDFTGEDTGIVDFGAINFDAPDSISSDSDSASTDSMPEDVMEPELLDTGKMDFGDVEEDAGIDMGDDIDFAGIDFGETDTGENVDDIGLDSINLGDEDAMDDAQALDTGDLDFGALDLTEASDVEDMVSTDDVALEDVMGNIELDTGELDFGDLDVEENDVQENVIVEESASADDELEDAMSIEALDTGELDFGDLTVDEVSLDTSDATDTSDNVTNKTADVMEDESLDTGAVDFGDFLSNSSTDETESKDESDSADEIEVDFDFSEMGASDTEEASSELSDMEKSIDLENYGIDFDETDSSENLLNEIDLEDDDLESTSAVQTTDETMVVSSGEAEAKLDDAINDRQVEQARAQAEEEANATAVEIPADAEDPFEAANALLSDAEESNLASDISNDDIDEIQDLGTDVLALDDSAKQSHDQEPLEDLDSISLDLSGFSEDTDSALDEVKAIEEELTSEVDLDGLDMIGDDLLIDADDEVSAEASTELDLDDFDLQEISLDEETEDSSTSKPASDAFDSTVIMDNTQKNLAQTSAADVKADNDHLASLDDMDSDKTLMMDVSSDPMEDVFNATGELENIETSIESLQNNAAEDLEATTELDGLMNDLKGLLDEDEPKK